AAMQPATFQFTSARFDVDEAAPSATVTVVRQGSLQGSASITFNTQDVTTTAGQDYVTVSTTLTFGAGEASKQVTIPILDDSLVEDSEEILLRLGDFNPSGGAEILP